MNTEKMQNEMCFGQRYDEELGILEPWYTNPAMDRIKQMDLSDKVVVEWGGGASTIWWRSKSKLVFTIDHNLEWCNWIEEQLMLKNLIGLDGNGNQNIVGEVKYVNTHEGDNSENRDKYVQHVFGLTPDICIVDGIHRYECAEYAVKVLKPEILIIDNHQQDYVFMCPSLDILLEGVKMERFIQPNHTDHSGNPWATAIFYLNEKNN